MPSFFLRDMIKLQQVEDSWPVLSDRRFSTVMVCWWRS